METSPSHLPKFVWRTYFGTGSHSWGGERGVAMAGGHLCPCLGFPLSSPRLWRQDYADTELLLSRENVDQEALLSYAREAADFSTQQQLPSLDFAINHYGQPDVAMFDFTCMYASENAALVREHNGHQLLVALVGDSLLEVRKGVGGAAWLETDLGSRAGERLCHPTASNLGAQGPLS